MKTETKPDYASAPTEDSFGFHGTILSNEKLSESQAENAWKTAFTAVRDEVTGGNEIMARNFLRSRWGRHLADDCSMHRGSLTNRIRTAVEQQWIHKALNDLKCDSTFGTELFEDDQLND